MEFVSCILRVYTVDSTVYMCMSRHVMCMLVCSYSLYLYCDEDIGIFECKYVLMVFCV